MFVPLDKQPEAIQKRGDRISIFRPEAERLLTLPEAAFSKLLRALLQWFKDGADNHLEDPMADCYLQTLKESQLRIVDEVWKKHLTNKANREKVRSGRVLGDGRQPSSTTEDDRSRSSANVGDCGQAEAKAKAEAKSKAQSEATSIPAVEEVVDWGKSERISEEFLRNAYDKIAKRGWTSSRGAIADWRKYFRAWSERDGGDVKTWHNKMLDDMNESERSMWCDGRQRAVLHHFAKEHNRPMVRCESGNYWPEPFDLIKEMRLASEEYDQAADRGEADMYYRSRYY